MFSFRYRIRCKPDGLFDLAHGSVPSGHWPTCRPSPLNRRKRIVDYDLPEDVDHTLIVLVETQFMYTDAIQVYLEDVTNVTKDTYNFSREMVDQFHIDMDEVIGAMILRLIISIIQYYFLNDIFNDNLRSFRSWVME